MRRTFPTRGLALLACTTLTAVSLAGAADPKKKKADPPPKVEENVGNVAKVYADEIRVEGVGLVVGLNNTGSDPAPSSYRTRLLNDMRKANVEHPEKWLARPSCSLVLVRATIPHGIATTDPLDVDIELPPASGTTSLAGGRLLMTELSPVLQTSDKGPMEGKSLARAGGPIMVGSLSTPKGLKVGRVLGGGRVKADIPYNLRIDDDRRSVRLSKLVEDVIKERFHQSDGLDQKGMASAKQDNLLILKVPRTYHHNQVRYFQVIQNMPLVRNPSLSEERMKTWGKELLDPKTTGKAALKLEGIGTNALPILREGLASTDPTVRFFSAEAIAYLGGVDAADTLAEAATTKPEYRSYALKALAAMDQSAGLMRLRKLMAQPDVELRYGAFDALRSFDASDPFLGQVAVFDEPADSLEDGEMSLQIADGRRRRRVPTREEPFKLYLVDCEGPPMIHVSRMLHAEIVVFGKGQNLLTPVVLGAGGAILLNASEGDRSVQVSRITHANLDEADSQVNSPLDIVEIIRNAAHVGATYPEIVGILGGANDQKNLPGILVVDAIPAPNKSYTQMQLTGGLTIKDDAVKKTSGETEAKVGLMGRVRGWMKR